MTTVAELLDEARNAGLTLTPKGDRITVVGPRSAEAFVPRIAARKVEVLAALTGPSEGTLAVAMAVGLPPELQQRWDEVASIMQSGTGMQREYAEFYALRYTLQEIHDSARARQPSARKETR